jgi:hypothetical protein
LNAAKGASHLLCGEFSSGFDSYFHEENLILGSFTLLVLLAWVKAGDVPSVFFEDFGLKAGLKTPVVYGGETQQKYILESTGTGVALFDYDDDGRPDIFSREWHETGSEGFEPAYKPPLSQ